MKETKFIAENKQKWSRFEELYHAKTNDPEELSDLYLEITDDLSYAQTFYPRRTVRVYLNQLAQRVFSGVHKQKSDSLGRFISVWKTSLPLELYRSRKNLLFALVAFLVYVLIGAATTYVDPDFPRVVMGDAYVNMTLENIQNGVPLDVYKSERQIDMFLAITTNNLKVAFLTFIVGFFFTLGTHVLLFYNGVMLGAFQYFFHTKGLLVTSFLGIWIHGAFEISAIVLAGGAGITAGSGLLFPKSYTRLQGLQLSTKRGLKIMLSLVPFIIAAGFLESFVTHNYGELPDWSKWMLILLSFAVIIFIYVLYPIYVARKNPHLVHREDAVNFKPERAISFHVIRSAGENIMDSVKLYRKIMKHLITKTTKWLIPVAMVLVSVQNNNHYDAQQTQHWFDWSAQFAFIFGYNFQNGTDFVVAIAWTMVIALFIASVLHPIGILVSPDTPPRFLSFLRSRFLPIWGGTLLLISLLFIPPWYLLLALFFLLPFVFLVPATLGHDPTSLGARIKKAFQYSKQHYGNSLLILLILLCFTAVIFQPIGSVFSIHNAWNDEPGMRDLLDVLADFVKRVTQRYTEDYMFWSNVLRQITYLGFLFFVAPLFIIAMSLGYYTELERTELKGLRDEFEKFGKRSRSKEKTVDFE